MSTDPGTPVAVRRRLGDAGPVDRLRTLALTKGVFLRWEAAELGYDDKAVARAVRRRRWVRVRRGAYTMADLWDPATPEEKHLIRAAAVMRSYGDRVALSHVSAALSHGLRVWDIDLRRVHVTRLDRGAGRTEPDVVHHEGFWLDHEVELRDGRHVVGVARAALETAGATDLERAVVVLDSALHLRSCTRAQLQEAHRVMRAWPGTRHLQLAVRMADGGGQSVGESRARHLCWSAGLPAPQTQFEVFDRWGTLIGITDFAWPEHRLLGEFDGRVKYGRLLRPGQDASEAVFAEKRREDALREVTQWSMIRLAWDDLQRPMDTAARIRRLMTSAA